MPVKIKKAKLVSLIVARLTANFATLEKAARTSHAEATHESSKAENKYDTRGLEAAYLAGGQARQAREILAAIKDFETLQLRDFTDTDPVDLGAFVELEADGVASTYFLGPKSGGLEIEKPEFMVITPQSPLGQNIVGRKQGDRWAAELGGTKAKYHLKSVI